MQGLRRLGSKECPRVVLGKSSTCAGSSAEQDQGGGALTHGTDEDEQSRGLRGCGPAFGQELVEEVGVEYEAKDQAYAVGTEGGDDDGDGKA